MEDKKEKKKRYEMVAFDLSAESSAAKNRLE